MDELVKRLRERSVFLFPHHGESRNYDADLMHEAADAIEELQKEVEFEKALAECWESLAQDCKARFQKLADARPKWISVEERLPECEHGCEIGNVEWISNGMVFAGCFGRCGKYRDEYFRTWTDATEGMDAKDADAWRIVTLPGPPKEDA